MNVIDHRYLICRAGPLQFVVALSDLGEVNRHATCYRVPHAPEGVNGLLNLRGVTYLVLDAGRLFAGAPVQLTKSTRLLFCKPHIGTNWALLVSEVGDMLHCEPEHLADMRSVTADAKNKTDRLLDQVVDAYAPLGTRGLPIVSLDKLYANLSAVVLERSQSYASAMVASGSSS